MLLNDGGHRALGPTTTRLLAARLLLGGTDREELRRAAGLKPGNFRVALHRARTATPGALDDETGLARPVTACVAEVLVEP